MYIPKDYHSGNSKGFAYVRYISPEAACQALPNLDGKTFQGRPLHVIHATEKKHIGLDEVVISKLPLKKQQQIRRKVEAASSMFSWNSLYMNVSLLGTMIVIVLHTKTTDSTGRFRDLIYLR